MATSDPEEYLKELPISEFQNILCYWENPRDDSEEKFMALLSSAKFQFDNRKFCSLVIKCLLKELTQRTSETKHVCPLFLSIGCLMKSSVFKTYPLQAPKVYKLINLFFLYFENNCKEENVVAMQSMLETFYCIKECEDLNFVKKEYGKNLKFAIQIFSGENKIPLKRVIMQFINFFIDGKEDNNDSSAVSNLPKFVKDYPRVLQNCGDFELQMMYTEAVTRLFNNYSMQDTGRRISTNRLVYDSFMSIDVGEFDKTCRVFLNNFNKLENNILKVYSFPCQGILFGKIRLKVSATNFSWMDVNQGSMCISFCCDVSSDGEDETLLPVFILPSEINRAGCFKHEDHPCLKLELKKKCEDYNLKLFDQFAAIRGNGAAFVFDKTVELQSLFTALKSIGLELKGKNAQEETPELEVTAASLDIAHKTSVAGESVTITMDRRQELSSASGFEDPGPDDMGSTLHDCSLSPVVPQEIRSSSKASVVDNSVSIVAEKVGPELEQSKVSQFPGNMGQNKPVGPEDLLKEVTVQEIPLLDTETSKNVPMVRSSRSPKKKRVKASIVVDSITCHEHTSVQQQNSSPISITSNIIDTEHEFCTPPFSPDTQEIVITDDLNAGDEVCTLPTVLSSPPHVPASASISECISPLAQNKNVQMIPLDKLSDRNHASLSSASSDETSKQNWSIENKYRNRLEQKRSNASDESELDLNMPSRFSTTSINEELSEPICKRKCKMTKKRRCRSSFVHKIALEMVNNSSSDEHSNSVPFKPERKWRQLASKRGNMLDDTGTNESSNGEKKGGGDCDVNLLGKFHEKESSTEANSTLSPLRKVYVNAAVQCTPTIIEQNSGKNSTNILPEICDKATMCSPGMISGPSSTIRSTSSQKRAHSLIANDVENGEISGTQQSSSIKRRLIFENSQENTDSFELSSSLNSIHSLERTKQLEENTKVISDFALKFNEIISSKLAELTRKSTSGFQDLIREFEKVWESQSQQLVDLGGQMTDYADGFFKTLQENMVRMSNLEYQQAISTNALLDGLEVFENGLEEINRQSMFSYDMEIPECIN